MATMEDDMVKIEVVSDTSSTSGCSLPDQEHETFSVTAKWTELNHEDIRNAYSSPSINELIKRNIDILNKHILNVMIEREEEIRKLLEDYDQDEALLENHKDIGDITLSPKARQELEHYVTTIASMYNNVLYHNFEHASHVMGSADALISIIKRSTSRKRVKVEKRSSMSTVSSTSARSSNFDTDDIDKKNISTFGISSCPMTHLALVFSALVHDVEHQGVGNNQLIAEKDPLAIKYDGRSIAENNSLDIARELLDQECFTNLRNSMFGDEESTPQIAGKFVRDNEKLFHDILTGTIQATDISSKERLDRNKEKWVQAFEDANSSPVCNCAELNKLPVRRQSLLRRSSVPPCGHDFEQEPRIRERRLSIGNSQIPVKCRACNEESFLQLDYLRASSVLEQMIQAADVAHTMQSWPIFMKWNIKLYDELWAANLDGRGPDVSANWYKGQISFFDYYICPLAKRLQQCGVFGEMGSLFLHNLSENRTRWLDQGEELCRQMHEDVLRKQGAVKNAKQ